MSETEMRSDVGVTTVGAKQTLRVFLWKNRSNLNLGRLYVQKILWVAIQPCTFSNLCSTTETGRLEDYMPTFQSIGTAWFISGNSIVRSDNIIKIHILLLPDRPDTRHMAYQFSNVGRRKSQERPKSGEAERKQRQFCSPFAPRNFFPSIVYPSSPSWACPLSALLNSSESSPASKPHTLP